jgi:zinc protease
MRILSDRPDGAASRIRSGPRRGAPVACAAAWLLLASPIPAQAPPDRKDVPVSKVERKGLAPVSRDVLRVRIPRPVEATLDNGLAVLVLEDARFPTVQVQMQVGGAGPIHEPAGLPGLADLTARMLTEGAGGRSSEALAREIETLGAEIGASAPFGSTDAQVTASGLSDDLDAWFPLVADVLLRPSFPADELAKMKSRLQVHLRQQRASPAFLAQEQFQRAVYGTHPASVVASNETALAALGPDHLRSWHRDRYVPQRAILGISGDVRAAELIPKLNRWLSGWTPSGGPGTWPARPEPLARKRLVVVDRPLSVQARMLLGGLAIDRKDPDYVPLVVMNRILGGGSSARLFLNLREEKGYTYGVYSQLTALKYVGPWRAHADVRTDVVGGALTEFLKEFTRMREEPVPAAELEESQRSLVAAFALSLERPDQLLGYALQRKIYGLPADYWDDYPTKVMAVTAADVMRVAKQFINLDVLQVVVVGDAAKIRPVLEPLGVVEMYDTDGRPAKP